MFEAGDLVTVVGQRYSGQSGKIVAERKSENAGLTRYEVKLDSSKITVVLQSGELDLLCSVDKLPATNATPCQGACQPDVKAAWDMACDALVNAAVDKDLINREREEAQWKIQNAENEIKAAKVAIKQLDGILPRLYKEAQKLVK